MFITFGLGLDAGAWPDELGEDAASSGRLSLGPRGLVALLEVHLGLRGRDLSAGARVADMRVAAARALQPGRFYARSFAADAWGVAETLLQMRDELRFAGWKGEAGSPRTSDLAAVEAHRSVAGLPDRLCALLEELDRPVPIEELAVVTPMELLPALWHRLFEKLAERGVRVVQVPPPSAVHADPDSDLGRLQSALLRGAPLSGAARHDGSLRFWRASTSVQAAEEIAAFVASQSRSPLLLGPSPLVDAALVRCGQAPTGASTASRLRAPLQILPMALELALGPPDPDLMLSFLELPIGPIEPAERERLRRAILDKPGSERAHPWFQRTDDVKAVAERVARWAEGVHEELAAQAKELAALPAPASLGELRALLEALQGAGLASAPLPAEAGAAPAVARADQIQCPVDTLVWCDFNAQDWPSAPASLFSESERGALGLPDGRRIADQPHDEGVRALLLARRVVLVGCGLEEESLPPLWHTLVGLWPGLESLAGDADLPRVGVPFVPERGARRHWNVSSARTVSRAFESHSSLSSLVGCPLQWLLRYHRPSRLERATAPGTHGGARLQGTLAHAVLREVLDGWTEALGPEEAQRAAGAAFERRVPLEAASLLQPGRETECESTQRAIALSAARLARILAEERASNVRMEHPVDADDPGLGPLRGMIDLVFDTPKGPVVIDLKWGSRDKRRADLAHGRATQLAMYAHMLGAEPRVGYFIVSGQEMLWPPPVVSLAATMREFSVSVRAMRAALAEGSVVATGIAQPNEKGVLEVAGGLEGLKPPCEFCGFDAFCGLRQQQARKQRTW